MFCLFGLIQGAPGIRGVEGPPGQAGLRGNDGAVGPIGPQVSGIFTIYKCFLAAMLIPFNQCHRVCPENAVFQEFLAYRA